ncbi:MAG TPA: SagB/ThcOx family dehydrogenase, partial [Vicinamibacterales bacterium]|nr:SagB/ThcOx family dehydrogenase [Vicinamibacterales bacterium]
MNRADALREVSRYHDGTKHHFHRFARSFGYLDWASQPHPFRSFHGARQIALSPQPGADRTDIGHLLRFALGLSAWKRGRDARWSLRVNPSSGNLHPTEAFVVTGPVTAVSEASGVYHYATDRHCLEERCVFDAGAWSDATTASVVALVALTSIHWREAWKYGERAFRYCQHDLGHAIASIRIAAALVGLRGSIAPEWSHREIARLTGIDRDEDYVEAEREEPGCLLVLFRGDRTPAVNRIGLLDATSRGAWSGRASQLSEDHVQWTFIDDVARATEEIGAARGVAGSTSSRQGASRVVDANLILRRRSALALDGRSTIDADDFLGMLSGVMPSN